MAKETIQRQYPVFGACGLNCGLCPNHYTNGASRCSGCGGEQCFNSSCPTLRCTREHGEIEYCFLCDEYPCDKYDGAEEFDSFITHQNMFANFEKVKNIGLEAYQAELDEKIAITETLLNDYNDGRRKNFYCIAVNLLELDEVKTIMQQLKEETGPDATLKEKAAFAVRLFQQAAEQKGIVLKLRKKPKEAK